MVHGLSECAALRYITPEDPLWQQAAAGLTGIIQAGLPAVNIMFVNQAQPADSAWQVLADTFETFLLGEGLPEGLQQQQLLQRAAGESSKGQEQQQRELQHSSSEAGSASFRQGAAQGGNNSGTAAGWPSTEEAALQKAVLDCLTEQVLGGCFWERGCAC